MTRPTQPICWTFLLLGCCWLVAAPPAEAQQQGYNRGDRVEVNRGDDWSPGTVTGYRGSRITVLLDDDGSHGDISADMLEKRLTRSYFSSDLRPLRSEPAAAANSPTRSPPAMRPAAPPSAQSPFDLAESTAESRTWKDQSGRFSIEASYGGMNGDKVVLQKVDGSTIEVPLDKLSDADQDFVNSQSEASENPFAVAPSTRPAMGGNSSQQLRVGDRSDAKRIVPQSFTEWTFVPEGAPPAKVAARSKPVSLGSIPDSDPFFEDVMSCDLSASGDRAIVARKQGSVGRDEAVYLEYINLTSGKSLGLCPLPPKNEVLSVDAETGRVVYGEVEFGRGATELTIGELNGNQLTPLVTWEPYGAAQREHERRIENAWFIGDGLVMTLGSHNNALTLWDATTAKAIAELPVSMSFGDDDVTISPDSRYLALKTDKSIAIIDLDTQEHVASISTGEISAIFLDTIAFRADNQMMAIGFHQGILIVNLQTGKIEQVFDHSTHFPHSSLVWAGNLLLHRNAYVYDWQRKILLWELEGLRSHTTKSSLKNGLLCVVPKNHDGPPVLRTLELPSPAMIAMQEKLGAPEDLIVASAGDRVSLKLDIDERVISAETVRQAVTANLEEAGYVVGDGSDLVVTAVCKKLPSQTIKINMGPDRFRARPEDIVERTITPHPSSLTLTYRGKKIWGHGNMGKPGMTIWMDENESVDQALQRLTTPNGLVD
ncbi:SHD1 domain-containing protein [Aeoliella mucimassa]|uniref:SLA1 homology domain-containing protein n=1 Tax=Aeoliella mucimassa TaxID=2527972 RepID=A0A518AW06_9BACT|nr:SHD1 domain-containing protein [Aeoliella mucimassa]QDU58904.1 hypothetical protein Pan181_51450 [Aeoliella mucimassa]